MGCYSYKRQFADSREEKGERGLRIRSGETGEQMGATLLGFTQF